VLKREEGGIRAILFTKEGVNMKYGQSYLKVYRASQTLAALLFAAIFTVLAFTNSASAVYLSEETSSTSSQIDTLVLGTSSDGDTESDFDLAFDNNGSIYLRINGFHRASDGARLLAVNLSSSFSGSGDYAGYTGFRETSESTSTSRKYYTRVRVELGNGDDEVNLWGNLSTQINRLDIDTSSGDDTVDSSLEPPSVTVFDPFSGTAYERYRDQGTAVNMTGDSGNDHFNLQNSLIDQTVRGGGGSDYVYGGSGDEVIYGNGGDSDYLKGGGGNDTFMMSAVDDGDDTFNGEAGTDTVDYSSRTDAVDASFAGFSGSIGQVAGTDHAVAVPESDSVLNIESVLTGSGDDQLTFTGTGSDVAEITVNPGTGSNSVDVDDNGPNDTVTCDEGSLTTVSRNSDDTSDGCYNITEDGTLIVENGSPVVTDGSGSSSGSSSSSSSGSGSSSGSSSSSSSGSGSSSGSSSSSSSGSGSSSTGSTSSEPIDDGKVVMTTHIDQFMTGLFSLSVSKRGQYPLSKKSKKSRRYRELTGYVSCDRDTCRSKITPELKIEYKNKTKLINLKRVSVKFTKAGKRKFTIKLSSKARKALKKFSKQIQSKRAKAWVDLTASASAERVSGVMTKTGDAKATAKIPVKIKKSKSSKK